MKTRIIIGLAGLLALAGCAETMELAWRDKAPSWDDVLGRYQSTTIGQTTSAEVLGQSGFAEYETVSQSESVIATQGQGSRNMRLWVNIIAFDEYGTTANRKYLTWIYEKPDVWLPTDYRKFRFQSQITIPEDIQNEPYADGNQKRIAILQRLIASFEDDSHEVTADNKAVSIASMQAAQTLRTILRILKESPAKASLMDRPDGMEFHHPNLNKGKVVLHESDGIAEIRIRAGLPREWTKDP